MTFSNDLYIHLNNTLKLTILLLFNSVRFIYPSWKRSSCCYAKSGISPGLQQLIYPWTYVSNQLHVWSKLLWQWLHTMIVILTHSQHSLACNRLHMEPATIFIYERFQETLSQYFGVWMVVGLRGSPSHFLYACHPTKTEFVLWCFPCMTLISTYDFLHIWCSSL